MSLAVLQLFDLCLLSSFSASPALSEISSRYLKRPLSLTVLIYRNFPTTFGSKDLAHQCIVDMADDGIHGGQIDMGMADGDTHTTFSSHPDAGINAFLDFMALMDATAIVRTWSSFSGTIVTMRGLKCDEVPDTDLSWRGLVVCLPGGISCKQERSRERT